MFLKKKINKKSLTTILTIKDERRVKNHHKKGTFMLREQSCRILWEMDGDAHIHTHRVYISVWPLSSALLVNTGNYLVSPKLAGVFGICPVTSSLKFPTVLWLLLFSSPTQTHPPAKFLS